MLDTSKILPRTAGPAEVLRASAAALGAGRVVGVATVVSRKGSAPSTPGQKLMLALQDPPHELWALGTVGGGAIERAVITAISEAIQKGVGLPNIHTFRLGPNLGMCCGGSADILVEVLRPGLSVLLVGGGHVGLATAKLLAGLDFLVVLVDAREQASEPKRVAEIERASVRVLAREHDDPEVLAALGAAPELSALVVMTHDHQLDQRVLEWALARRFRFVGGVGSRAKAERTRQRLAQRSVALSDIERVRMPVGVRVGARRPNEIAVAIAAELIAWRASIEGVIRGAEPEAPETQPTTTQLGALEAAETETEDASLPAPSGRV